MFLTRCHLGRVSTPAPASKKQRPIKMHDNNYQGFIHESFICGMAYQNFGLYKAEETLKIIPSVPTGSITQPGRTNQRDRKRETRFAPLKDSVTHTESRERSSSVWWG